MIEAICVLVRNQIIIIFYLRLCLNGLWIFFFLFAGRANYAAKTRRPNFVWTRSSASRVTGFLGVADP
jgi:hypothetical protein